VILLHHCSIRYTIPILEGYKDYDDETKLKALMLSLSGYKPLFKEDLERDLKCSCLYAWYDKPAPVIITLSGSVIRGMFILPNGFILPPTPLSTPIVFYSPYRDYVCKILPDMTRNIYKEVYNLIETIVRQKCPECIAIE